MNNATQELINIYRELSRLTKKLDDHGHVTPSFVKSYLNSNAPYAIKTNLLQRVLYNTSKVDQREITAYALNQIARFFIYHPEAPLSDPATLDIYSVPATIKNAVGLTTKTTWAEMLHYIGRLYSTWETQQWDNVPACIHISAKDDLSPLLPFYNARLLSPQNANERFSGKQKNRTAKGIRSRFYFNSGDLALDIRNVVVFYQAFFHADRKKGHIANDIPNRIADLFGIRRNCIPDFQLAMDVLSLGYIGVIQACDISAADDFLGIKDKLHYLSHHAVPDDLDRQLRNCASLWFFTDQSAQDWLSIRDIYGRTNGVQYDTSFWFNLDRLVHREKFMRFSHYYDLPINTAAMTCLVHDHYRQIDADFVASLKQGWRRLNTQTSEGIRRRDLANCLYYLRANDAHSTFIAGNLLPSVGRFALGAKESSVSSKKPAAKSGVSMNPKGSSDKQRSFHLPILETLWS